MRQIIIPRHGEPEVLEVRESPDPLPAAGEVRVHSWKRSYGCLCPTGRLVIFGMSRGAPDASAGKLDMVKALLNVPWLTLNPMRLLGDSRAVVGVNLQRIRTRPDDARRWMGELLGWYEAGRLRPRIDRTFAFGEAAEAHRYIQERKNLGKVLLVP